ncbi:MAG TPA: hypothetical protein VFZ61_21070, partial [Polyangiales bacterium]
MSPRRPEKPAPVIVKRPSDERKKLPPELEAFARSQDEKLRLRRPRRDEGRINDPREGYTIAGVSNRDARAVYDARAEAMRALWADGKATPEALAELGQLLHDAARLTLWRARRITGFDAFVEQVVGVGAEPARGLLEAYSAASGESPAPVNERTVAAWLRTEAGLFEGDPEARVQLRTVAGAARLVVSVSLSGASAAFAGAGARHAPLAREGVEAVPAKRDIPTPAREIEALEASAEAESEGDASEAPVARAPARPRPEAPAAGGARLLTRKRAPDASAGDADTGFAADPGAARDAKRERFGRKHDGEGAYPQRNAGAREGRFEGGARAAGG